jgi:hypothetical protein
MTTPSPNHPQGSREPAVTAGHAAASAWQFTPEVAAAAITLVVAVLAHVSGSGPRSLLPRTEDLTIVAAVTVLIAAVVGAVLRSKKVWTQFATCLIVTLGLLFGYAGVAHWLATRPGRDARAAAAHWLTIPVPNANRFGRFSAGRTTYGTGWVSVSPDLISIHLDSSQSNLIAFYPSRDPGQHYYAQVSARAVSGGSIGTACALIFGYENANRFYQLAMRFDGLQLARWEGHIPARAFAGPASLSYGNDPAQWHVLAVMRDGPNVTAYVDDRKLLTDNVGESFTGGVTFGTLDIGTGYTEDAQCDFKNWEIRSAVG